jgi:hypothetical protein
VEKTADIESATAPTSIDDAPVEAKIDNSDDQRPDQEADGSDNSGRSIGDPWASAPRIRCANRRALRMPMTHYFALSLFLLCSL